MTITGNRTGRSVVLATLSVLLLATWPASAAESLKGHLLVAAPEMVDSNFAKTLVFMVHHDPTGAFGLVINEPMGEMPVERLLERIELPEAPEPAPPDPTGGARSVTVYYGGPVEPTLGAFLHSPEIATPSSVEVEKGIAFTRDLELLRHLAQGEGPARLLFVLGYSGWAPGQLESELERGDWYVLRAPPSFLFDADDAGKWDRAIALSAPEL